MTALGKTMAASTLAIGLAVFASSTASASSQYNDWDNKGYNHNKRDYKNDDNKYNKHDFYNLSWDDRYRLCNDEDSWNNWGWYYGDRDQCCGEFKDYNKHDNHWGRNNDDYSKDYNKDVSYNDSYYKKDTDHEKDAYYVEASRHDSDNYGNSNYNSGDYGRDYDGWGKHGGDSWNDNSWNNGSNDYSYNNEDSNYKAEGYHQKDAVNVVKADVSQDTSVNNHVNVYGDNNNVYNNISVNNYANVEQKAAVSQVDYAAVEYNNSSNNGYGSSDYGNSDNNYGHDGWKDNDHGYGSNNYASDSYGNSSHDESYKAAVYSEKSSTSEVKKTSDYNLNETYRASEDDDDGHSYSHSGYGYDDEGDEEYDD